MGTSFTSLVLSSMPYRYQLISYLIRILNLYRYPIFWNSLRLLSSLIYLYLVPLLIIFNHFVEYSPLRYLSTPQRALNLNSIYQNHNLCTTCPKPSHHHTFLFMYGYTPCKAHAYMIILGCTIIPKLGPKHTSHKLTRYRCIFSIFMATPLFNITYNNSYEKSWVHVIRHMGVHPLCSITHLF